MVDMSHLDALRLGLSHERARLSSDRTERERELRRVWIAQHEREIAAELAFLELPADAADDRSMTDEELLAELGS